MTAYLYAVQTAEGREVCSWAGEVTKVSEVTARLQPPEVDGEDWQLFLEHATEGEIGWASVDQGPYTLHRWPADDKLTQPVSHPVVAVEPRDS